MNSSRSERAGYQITDDELKKIQRIQLDMILELDRVCKKNGITYNIVGGTMLGAARHAGYIPWDDDADIGFLRSEYNKFREACKRDLDSTKYYFQDYHNTPGYRWGYGKIRRKDTQFVRLNQESAPYEQGIFIDIMPFDNVPDNAVHRKVHFAQCFLFRKAFWAPIGKNQASGMEQLMYKLIKKIPEKALYNSYDRFIEKGSRRHTKQVRILTFPTPRGKYGYDREWYEELSTIGFEGVELPCPREYEAYLSYKYGDYMTLPPIEKRKVHPISKLELVDIETKEEKKNEEI